MSDKDVNERYRYYSEQASAIERTINDLSMRILVSSLSLVSFLEIGKLKDTIIEQREIIDMNETRLIMLEELLSVTKTIKERNEN